MKNFLVAVALTVLLSSAAFAAPIASDDAEGYATSWNYNDNGGSGFGPVTYLEGSGGGIFLSTDGAHIDGAKSFGMFSGGAGQAASRQITGPITAAEYSLSARFNLDNSVGFSGFNIKSSQGSTFGTGELLSFGLRPADGNANIYVGGSVDKQISLPGEIRGAVIDFDLIYNTSAGTYDLGAKYRASGSFTRVTGNLKATGQVASFIGIANFNNGGGQDLITDNLLIVPEPASMSLLAVAAFASFARRRRVQH